MKHPNFPAFVVIAILITLLAGCIPADTPPQLDFTPGPEFQITTTDYANQAYSLSYPAAWRVISGPSNAADQVILVSPDDEALIIVNTSPIDSLPTIEGVTDTQSQYVEITDLSIHAYLLASEATIQAFEPVFEQVISSVSLP